jgi:2-oxo-hept-3-ene-1,7-dioate hydratase
VTRTLTDAQNAEIAARHEEARLSRQPIRRITAEFPEMTLDDAYANQRAWIDLQVAAGARVIGHKIGLTSRAMQMSMNIGEPDFGTLLDYMDIPNGSTLVCADYLDPKIEVELAFVLSEPLEGADLTPADVYAATDYIIPALELIDARSYRTDPTDKVSRTVRDTISDNAANAGIVTGGNRIDPADVVAGRVDLRWVGAIANQNGTAEETGLAAGVLDDPVQGIIWLARRFAPYGIKLEAGQVILSGSFTRPLNCKPGTDFVVDFGPHGVITMNCV